MLKIPIDTTFAATSQEVTLEGIPYRFSFTFNSRGLFWAMSIATRELVEILSGVKMVPSYGLIGDYRHLPLPPGELTLVDTSGEEDKPNRNNIGISQAGEENPYQLIYATEEEVLAIVGES